MLGVYDYTVVLTYVSLMVSIGGMMFPAEPAGGVAMIKAMAAPYNQLRFMPTGGIGTLNLKDYLGFDKIICSGGSWMVKADLIKNGEFEKICNLTKEAKELAKSIRP